MKDIVEWDVKHLKPKKQAFGAFKGWLKTIQASNKTDAHSVQMRMLSEVCYSI